MDHRVDEEGEAAKEQLADRMMTEQNKPLSSGLRAKVMHGLPTQGTAVVRTRPEEFYSPATANRRVAVLTNIPAPYRLKLFELIGKRHNLKVFFDGRSEPNRQWNTSRFLGFAHEFVPSMHLPYHRKRSDAIPGEQRYLQISYGLLPCLQAFSPELVVAAELGMRTLQAAAYCRIRSIPLIIWWEGTEHTEGWVSPAVQRIRRMLVGSASRFWTNGSAAAALLRSYGASAGQVDIGMTGCDTDSLLRQISERLPERARLRNDLGLSGTVFLFVGRFVKPKGIWPFVAGLERLRSGTTMDFSVLLVGGGPERALLDTWQASHPTIRTKILDFQHADQLADLYTAADVFVLPTLDDNWSLVSLEAAVAGLPQLFSPFNGATSDLLAWHAKGVCVNPYETETFAHELQRYVESPPPRITDPQQTPLLEYFSSEALASRACQSIEKTLLV